MPNLESQDFFSRDEDHSERLAHRPPFAGSDGSINEYVEGRLAPTGKAANYIATWLVYVGVDEGGRPKEYDEVTKRRYLGDIKPLGEI